MGSFDVEMFRSHFWRSTQPPRFSEPGLFERLREILDERRARQRVARACAKEAAAPRGDRGHEGALPTAVPPITHEEWEQLRKDHEGPLLEKAIKAAHSLGFSEADARDCVLRAFTERIYYTMKPVDNPWGWLLHRTMGRLRDLNQRRRRDREHHVPLVEDPETNEEHDPEGRGPEPAALVVAAEAAAELERLIVSAAIEYAAIQDHEPLVLAVLDWLFHYTDVGIKVAHLAVLFGTSAGLPGYHLTRIVAHIRARVSREYRGLTEEADEDEAEGRARGRRAAPRRAATFRQGRGRCAALRPRVLRAEAA